MSIPTIEGAGVELAYEESGSGPPVLFVHGSGCTRAIWRETIDELGDGCRAIAYDRRGYGASGAPEGYTGTTFEEQAEDAAAVTHSLGAAPAVLCGHSLGAGACLDLMKRHAGLLRGAVLVEPPVLSLSPSGLEAMSENRETMERGAREGGPAGAVEAVLRTYGGQPLIDRLGPERVEAALSSARPFAADLAAAAVWSFTRRDLRGMETPAIVIRGELSSPAWRESAEALAALLPNARLRDARAGHFVPVEAPAAVAAAVGELVRA